MQCLNCKSEELMCHVQASIYLPLSQRGGTVLLKGFNVTQADIKAWWDKVDASTAPDAEDRKIRGPIVCADCGTEHTYFVGLVPSLRKVSLGEALELGYDAFAQHGASTGGSEE